MDRGVTLTTVGFGMGNYNDVLMEQLANDGNGSYHYVDDISEAQRIFVENLTGTLQTIAKDSKVQVDFNPEVVSRYRLLGYENRRVDDEDFRDDTVDAGEVGAGHSVTALYELKLHDGASGNVGTVFVRYENSDSGQIVETSQTLQRSDLLSRFDDASTSFQLAAVVAEFAEILRKQLLGPRWVFNPGSRRGAAAARPAWPATLTWRSLPTSSTVPSRFKTAWNVR